MAYDALLWLLGNSTSPSETIATTNITRAGTLLAPNRLYIAELRVGGPVTGTAPTLDITVQASSTGSTAWSTLATFPQQSTAMTITAPENTTSATQSGVVRRSFMVSAAQPYVHLAQTVSAGTTAPSFSNVTLVVVPVDADGIAGA